MPFPARWCEAAFPVGMTEAMLAAWQAEVTEVWPELGRGEVLAPRVAEAELVTTWVATWEFLAGQGSATAALLVDRWERVATDAALLDARSAKGTTVAEHAAEVAEGLRRHHGVVGALPLYPAFR